MELCSCRLLSGDEKSRCGGSFGSQGRWSQLEPFLLPLTAHTGAWTGISNSQQTGGSHQLGTKSGGEEGRWRKMFLCLVTENLWNVLCFFLQCAGFVFQNFPQQILRPALSSTFAFQCLLMYVTIEFLIKKKGKAQSETDSNLIAYLLPKVQNADTQEIHCFM